MFHLCASSLPQDPIDQLKKLQKIMDSTIPNYLLSKIAQTFSIMPPKKPKPEAPLVQAKEESQHQSYAISEEYEGGMREGRWTFNESNLFMRLYQQHNNNWIQIALRIPTRTAEQVRSHAQKILSRQKRKEAEKRLREDTLRRIQREGGNRVTRSFANKDNHGHDHDANPPQQSKPKNKKQCKKKQAVKTKKNQKSSNGEMDLESPPSKSQVTQNNTGSKSIIRPQFVPPRQPVESKSLLYQIFSPSITKEYFFPLFAENSCKVQQRKSDLADKNSQNF